MLVLAVEINLEKKMYKCVQPCTYQSVKMMMYMVGNTKTNANSTN